MATSWITKKAVPILDEHVLKDADGKEIVTIDAAKLGEIAKKNNERVARTGDLTPIVIGHTKDDADEPDQPEIVGYACNFRVAPFKKTGKQAVVADFKFRSDKKALVNKYPRRSVELWLSDWKIDPIALLGATTPERDLGLLQLSRDGKKKLRRIMYSQDTMPGVEGQPPAGETDGIVQAILSALEQTDVFQWVHQQMEAEQAAPPLAAGGMDPMGLPPEPPMPEEMGLEDEYDDEEEEVFDDEDDEDEDEGEDDEDEEEDDEDEPVKYQGMPSGTNTYCPTGTMNKKKMQKPVTAPAPSGQVAPHIHALAERIRLSAQQREARLARYERAFVGLARDYEGLKLRLQRAEREKDLIQMEAEGYAFDRGEELEALADLPEDAYKKAVVRLRKNYAKAPVNRVDFSANALRSNSPGAGTNEDSMKAAVSLALDKGISYDEARKQLLGQ